MIFIILPTVCMILGIAFYVFEWGFDDEAILNGVMSAMVGLIVALLLWVILVCCLTPTVVSTDICELKALADNARYSGQVTGSVFLVQGRVDETLKYSYMYEVEGKGFAFNEVDAECCYINSTTDTPYVEIRQYDYNGEFWQWLLPNVYGCEYSFYLPESAEIIDDFVIDFE